MGPLNIKDGKDERDSKDGRVEKNPKGRGNENRNGKELVGPHRPGR